MNDRTKCTRPLRLLDGVASLALSLLLHSGCASAPRVPQALAVPSGHQEFLCAHALGVQIYVSRTASIDDATLRWELKGPEAMLFDDCGNVIGSHYAGPTWESRRYDSKVAGSVLQRVPAPAPDAIPWLLLQSKSTEGSGQFQRVTYIHRLNTQGGLAPAAPPTRSGQEVRIHYSADYVFYRARHEGHFGSPAGSAEK